MPFLVKECDQFNLNNRLINRGCHFIGHSLGGSMAIIAKEYFGGGRVSSFAAPVIYADDPPSCVRDALVFRVYHAWDIAPAGIQVLRDAATFTMGNWYYHGQHGIEIYDSKSRRRWSTSGGRPLWKARWGKDVYRRGPESDCYAPTGGLSDLPRLGLYHSMVPNYYDPSMDQGFCVSERQLRFSDDWYGPENSGEGLQPVETGGPGRATTTTTTTTVIISTTPPWPIHSGWQFLGCFEKSQFEYMDCEEKGSFTSMDIARARCACSEYFAVVYGPKTEVVCCNDLYPNHASCPWSSWFFSISSYANLYQSRRPNRYVGCFDFKDENLEFPSLWWYWFGSGSPKLACSQRESVSPKMFDWTDSDLHLFPLCGGPYLALTCPTADLVDVWCCSFAHKEFARPYSECVGENEDENEDHSCGGPHVLKKEEETLPLGGWKRGAIYDVRDLQWDGQLSMM
mmetsp:Transcript_88915/g.176872  ORF Transcript_88915/g.176872 Transcript_88915/m.176872 type:complete len:455 (-) Transcript_88915:245-1609(-)